MKTSKKSPGSRKGHFSFIYNHGLYVLGGSAFASIGLPMKLFRLDLKSFEWSVIKHKGQQPSAREELAGCFYKDKLYIHGGNGKTEGFLNDLWMFDFSTKRWTLLSSTGSHHRSCHSLWCAHDKVYIFGGEYCHPKQERMERIESIRAFECFDLKRKQWTRLRCVGDDPWRIQEFSVLPIYDSKNTDDPKCIILWGGYTDHTKKKGLAVSKDEFEALYGDEYQEYSLSYRKRMLLFDMETMTWTNLLGSDTSMPSLAQCFMLEIGRTGDVLHLLVGGGYGHTYK